MGEDSLAMLEKGDVTSSPGSGDEVLITCSQESLQCAGLSPSAGSLCGGVAGFPPGARLGRRDSGIC